MVYQLKLNNSGSWKTVLHDINPDDLNAVRLAVLGLMASDRSTTGRSCWKIDCESAVHPGGERRWFTQRAGADAKWVEKAT